MALETNRRFKILGIAWVGLGGFFLVVVLINMLPLVQGNTPEGLFESGSGWWIVDLVFLSIGTIWMVNGLALLRRNPAARSLTVVSSLLLLPASGLVVPLLVVAPSLWLVLSRGGKEAFERYLATASA